MRILLVEDNQELCDAISVQLEKNGYLTDICNNGEDAMYYMTQDSYDLIILDRMLPKIDGLTLLRSLRARGKHTPVIMATAMNQVTDRIDGLDTGADDYIVKPFHINELLARIRALTRRPGKIQDTVLLQYGDLSLDTDTLLLQCQDKTMPLSKREALLLGYFLKNKEQTLSRAILLSHVWGPDTEVEDGNLDHYIHFIRKRLKSLKSNVSIKTVHRVGYRIEYHD